jgi:pimeloyl-ACP methyl ester carboxylesterase
MIPPNGAHDVMINSYATYAMAQRLPKAKVIHYSDAGHGYLFQHSEDFTHEINRFLASADGLACGPARSPRPPK